MFRTFTAAASLAALFALTGCASEEVVRVSHPSASPPQSAPLSVAQRSAVQGAMNETGVDGLRFDADILALCPGVEPPKFAFDSAAVKTKYEQALAGLANCMREGKLKDRDVLLVGHADPRGEEDYNLALGGRRAHAVKSALAALGAEEARLDISSRGEAEASGTDEASWQLDRRVDVLLRRN